MLLMKICPWSVRLHHKWLGQVLNRCLCCGFVFVFLVILFCFATTGWSMLYDRVGHPPFPNQLFRVSATVLPLIFPATKIAPWSSRWFEEILISLTLISLPLISLPLISLTLISLTLISLTLISLTLFCQNFLLFHSTFTIWELI